MPFAAPLRSKIERDAGALAFEAPAPCGTMTISETCGGGEGRKTEVFIRTTSAFGKAVSLSVPTAAGLALPLTTILAVTKFFPVPDASTCTFWIDLELSAPPLKSVIEGETFPFASA